MSATEQCATMKCCVLLHKSTLEIFFLQLLKEVYGEMAMKKTQVYGWHKCSRAVVNNVLRCK
jgi:hypothetical protein